MRDVKEVRGTGMHGSAVWAVFPDGRAASTKARTFVSLCQGMRVHRAQRHWLEELAGTNNGPTIVRSIDRCDSTSSHAVGTA